MLFLNFTGDHVDSFKSKFHDIALHNKGKGISFLIADVEASQGPLEVIVFPPHPFLLLFLIAYSFGMFTLYLVWAASTLDSKMTWYLSSSY